MIEKWKGKGGGGEKEGIVRVVLLLWMDDCWQQNWIKERKREREGDCVVCRYGKSTKAGW